MCGGAGVVNVLIRPVDVLILPRAQRVLVTAEVVAPHPWAGQEAAGGSPIMEFMAD